MNKLENKNRQNRVPLSPLNVLDRNGQQTDKKLQINDLWLFLLPESPASKTSKGLNVKSRLICIS